jgi:hypothetical protein
MRVSKASMLTNKEEGRDGKRAHSREKKSQERQHG